MSYMQTPYYDKPTFKLFHGDCLDILAGLPENSVDMIFADPLHVDPQTNEFGTGVKENYDKVKNLLGL